MTSPFTDIKACVFDAYGTLLDVNSAALRCKDELGDKAQPLAETWRNKQLQYTWLRSLMQRHEDFREVTESSLDFSMQAHGLADDALRTRLLELFEVLTPYPEVAPMLEDLKKAGMATAILSNGSPQMLENATTSAAIDGLLDHVLSIEDVGVYKPDPRVYQLAVDRLKTPKENICFVSSNGWDAAGAAAFGFQVAWCNRTGQPSERLNFPPKVVLTDLSGLAELVI